MPVISTRAYDPTLRAVVDEARHDARHGHDREAGRHRCPRQHDAGGARGRRLPHHRAQMVHVGADVRRVPGAGAGRSRPDLLLPAALSRRTDRSTRLQFQRLKDKLGNRSNASSEVEFADAYAVRVGEEGKGIRTIIQMVQLTRLDCAIASAGHDAHGARAGAASRPPSQRVPEASGRSADDARGAGRHGAAMSRPRSRW